VGHAINTGETGVACKTLVGKLEGRRLLERTSCG